MIIFIPILISYVLPPSFATESVCKQRGLRITNALPLAPDILILSYPITGSSRTPCHFLIMIPVPLGVIGANFCAVRLLLCGRHKLAS